MLRHSTAVQVVSENLIRFLLECHCQDGDIFGSQAIGHVTRENLDRSCGIQQKPEPLRSQPLINLLERNSADQVATLGKLGGSITTDDLAKEL